jgi:hypothetical protein
MARDLKSARLAKERLRSLLRGRTEVVGIGLARGSGGYCLKVNLREASAGDLPTEIDDIPIRYETVGTIRATG